jgi:hypothetical protein
LDKLGIPCGGGDDDQVPEPLHVTHAGNAWLGRALRLRIAAAASAVNRALPTDLCDPGHLALVAGETRNFVGAYRLGGRGWLWRIGGFDPNPDVALPVAVAATEHVLHNVPRVAPQEHAPMLWHATLVAGGG